MDDSAIVELFLDRNEDAIGEVRKKYGKKLRFISENIGLNFQDAEEIENDTYHTLWNKIPPYAPKTYLFGFSAKIMREKSINLIKSRNAQKRSAEFTNLTTELEECIAHTETVDSEFDMSLLTKTVNAFLRTLGEEKRNIFLRRYWFMDSVKAISEMYFISESKVKTVLFRVRKELKEYLEREGYSI
ncbi:MAG: sigma-70 family RNA polymerase sigma factor [Ruminococcus sp.]|nr:sigma-70 family RNA polymerase sigma factor [Candidatus Copronaster equi]